MKETTKYHQRSQQLKFTFESSPLEQIIFENHIYNIKLVISLFVITPFFAPDYFVNN